jgi:hypothetical protein
MSVPPTVETPSEPGAGRATCREAPTYRTGTGLGTISVMRLGNNLADWIVVVDDERPLRGFSEFHEAEYEAAARAQEDRWAADGEAKDGGS